MQKTIGIVLIIAAFVLGYFGYEKMEGSKAGIKIGDVEISAKDNSSQGAGYALLGGGALCLIIGAVMVARKK